MSYQSKLRVVLVIVFLSICTRGIGGSWAITDPTYGKTYWKWDNITVKADGTGTPGGGYTVGATSQTNGGENLSSAGTGTYNPAMPPPQAPSKASVVIDPCATGNTSHWVGQANLIQFVEIIWGVPQMKDYEYVTITDTQ